MKRNSIFLGCIFGIPAPLTAYLLKVLSPLGITMHPLSLYVVGALINLLLIRLFYWYALDRTARGVLLTTFIAVILLIFVDKLRLA